VILLLALFLPSTTTVSFVLLEQWLCLVETRQRTMRACAGLDHRRPACLLVDARARQRRRRAKPTSKPLEARAFLRMFPLSCPASLPAASPFLLCCLCRRVLLAWIAWVAAQALFWSTSTHTRRQPPLPPKVIFAVLRGRPFRATPFTSTTPPTPFHTPSDPLSACLA